MTSLSLPPPPEIIAAYDTACSLTSGSRAVDDPLRPTTVNINGNNFTGSHIFYNHGYVNIDGVWSIATGRNQVGNAHVYNLINGGMNRIFAGVRVVTTSRR